MSVVSNISGSATELGPHPRRSPLRPDLLSTASGFGRARILGPDLRLAPVSARSHSDRAFHDADADAMQAPKPCTATAELATGVQHRVEDLERVLACRVLADGHAAAVVDDFGLASRELRVRDLGAWPAIASSIELSTTSTR